MEQTTAATTTPPSTTVAATTTAAPTTTIDAVDVAADYVNAVVETNAERANELTVLDSPARFYATAQIGSRNAVRPSLRRQSGLLRCVGIPGRGGRAVARQRRAKQRGGGELEAAVMEALWDHGGWMTPGEVHDVLGDDLAYNTVLTILVRLWDKERLERQRDGRSYVYRPLLSREEYVATRMSTVLGEAKDRSAAMVGFLESLDERDRTQLRRMLDGLGRGRR